MRLRCWPGVLLVTILTVTTNCRTDRATPVLRRDTPAFDPGHASVVASVGNVVAWGQYDVPPGVAGPIHEGSINYIVTYYLQHIGGEPEVVFRGRDERRFGEPATVLPDDAILLLRGNTLVWLRKGKVARSLKPEIDGRPASVYAVFPGGVIASSWGGRDGDPTPLWWLPLRGDGSDAGAKVRLESDLGRHGSPSFVRHGDMVAWIDSTHVAAGGEPAGKVPLFVFDIARRQTRSVKIQDPVGEGAHLSAFDGRHGIEGTELFDTSTGKVEDIKAMGNLRDVLRHTTLAMIDNRVYFVLERRDRFELMAVPVDDLSQGKIVYRITKSALAKPPSKDRLYASDLFFANEKTIYAWNGTTWEDILAKQ